MSLERSNPPSGVLLVNLGTPDAPTAKAVRRYLAEFLSDRRVVEIPRLIWLPILYGLILTLRPGRVAGNYAAIWTEGGSPLLAISRQQAAALQASLGEAAHVELAMRYGNPDLAAALQKLREQGCNQIIVLPMYPQYSATTTASVFDAVFDFCRSQRNLPALNMVRDYHDEPAYIAALASSVQAHWQAHGKAQRLLMSFHGIPQRNVELGDPYARQCEHTATLLANALQLGEADWAMTYQSRFGKAAWLQPYTDKTLAAWGAAGIRTVDVICPGFPADCLETLEEIRVENADVFKAAGGEQLHYIPALNERPEHIKALTAIIRKHMAG